MNVLYVLYSNYIFGLEGALQEWFRVSPEVSLDEYPQQIPWKSDQLSEKNAQNVIAITVNICKT